MTSGSKKLSSLNIRLQEQMDRLLEGVQIIDSDWKYVYINDVLSNQINIPKYDLLGKTMMEAFPGIEQTPMFASLKKCRDSGEQQRFENHFIFEDGTSKWFEIVCSRTSDGLCILTLDVSLYRETLQSNERIKNLYSFIRQINQNIVHTRNEKELLNKACQIAVSDGKFSLAWIGLVQVGKPFLQSVGLFPQKDVALPRNFRSIDNEVQQNVLNSGNSYVVDSSNRHLHPKIDELLSRLKMESMISLPVRKSGKIFATFNLYSEKRDFMGAEEIDLLLEVSGDLSFAIDNFERIRKHKKVEKLVLENEKRFRALIEKSNDMKTLADASGKLFYGSPSVTKVLGYVATDLGGLKVYDFIHPQDLPSFIDKRRKLQDEPNSYFQFEMRLRHKQGHYLWTEGTVTNLLEEPGINAIVSNFRDISEKHNALQQLEFDRRNMEALINNTNDLEWSVDKFGKLIISNRRFDEYMEQIYGKTLLPGEFILHSGMSTNNFEIYKPFYTRALNGESFSEIVQTSNNSRYAEISFYPIRLGKEIIGTACNARDITAQLALQKNLEDNIEQLVRANAELDRFVYSISHDLRSPLTSIRGLLAIIEEETAEPETAEHIKLINGRIDRLDMFIKNVLNYSRINRTEVDIQKIDPQQITQEIIDSLSGIKLVDDIKIEIGFDQKVPFCTDRQAFSTIMENLISNAIKFQDQNRPEKYIRISGISDSDQLKFVVEDNGVGIPKLHQKDIFKMFYRLPGVTEGSGIGLYIVHEAVEKLNGTIHLDSFENGGSRFMIQLKNLNDGNL